MTIRCLVLPFAALLSAGCGTISNLNPTDQPFSGPQQDDAPRKTRVFGGVRSDWTGLTTLDWNDNNAMASSIILPLYVADLPLSLVGDTMTLPYTALRALCNKHAGAKDRMETSNQPDSIAIRGQSTGQSAGGQESPPNNLLAPFSGNQFNSWTISPRIDIPVNR